MTVGWRDICGRVPPLFSQSSNRTKEIAGIMIAREESGSTRKRGVDVLHDSESNKSTAFIGAEHEALSLTGRLSSGIALETQNLSRAIVGKVLVNDISVAVQQGEVLAVVGPSGAGKSSFLRLLNRLDEPTSGAVLLDGRNYNEIAPRELRRRVGMVMQMAYLFPGTVAANIAFGPQQRHETITPQQIQALLDRVGLPGYQDRDVSNLSGGEAQRVSLARTLANSPEVLLLDEPTSALDDASERGIEELVLGIIRERQMTCVIVTHDMPQAARIADRTMVLESGKLAAIGPTEGVLHAR